MGGGGFGGGGLKLSTSFIRRTRASSPNRLGTALV
jgi:hypothetical protein